MYSEPLFKEDELAEILVGYLSFNSGTPESDNTTNSEKTILGGFVIILLVDEFS